MVTTLKPETTKQVEEAVAWAASNGEPLEILGGGSKRKLGAPMKTEHLLDLSGLSGISLYEPEELVMSAGAGTPLAEIEGVLNQRNQRLAFEPGDLGAFYGGDGGKTTIGGALACNLSGPRRIWSGAARDHFLGCSLVNGRGETIKSGGRVVKNVTGFDLCKVIAGSFGTLGAMTEVTFKVLPATEESRTVVVEGCNSQQAVDAMSVALSLPFEVSGAAFIPGRGAVARIEGPSVSVAYKADELGKKLEGYGSVSVIGGEESAEIWNALRNLTAIAGDGKSQVWRISMPPSQGAAVAESLAARLKGNYVIDWGGALAWLAIPPGDGAAIQQIRDEAFAAGGYAELYRADEAVRAVVPLIHGKGKAHSLISDRLKKSFDPRGVLNPGRLDAGGEG